MRKCSSNLACLQDTPSDYGEFPDSTSDDLVFRSELGSVPTLLVGSQTQYKDSDMLLQDNGADPASRFMFPAQFHGDLCAMSPVKFYSEVVSSCRKKVDVSAICQANSMFDYSTYLKSLLSFPRNNASLIDLSNADDIVFYCLDSSKGVKEKCTIDPLPATPKISNGRCINVVKEVEIYLTVSAEKMAISSSSVHITLTSISTSEVQISQKFSISYKPSSQVNLISGNFGYVRGSHVLSGTVSGTEVVMNSDSGHRVLSLFQSQNCREFSDLPIRFGTGYYTGCKMELPDFTLQEEKISICRMIRNISGSVFNNTQRIVVGGYLPYLSIT